MSSLKIYNEVRKVPQEAKKSIIGGRLKGMTDINPMWRIKALTEQFGIVGIGWKYEITKQWIEEGGKGEKAAFCNINLYIKHDGEWSAAIPGTGGSSFIANEKHGPYTSDECFKMALTDALSVACKALGFGADVYWEKDKSKYDKPANEPQPTKTTTQPKAQPKQTNATTSDLITEAQRKRLFAIAKGDVEKMKSVVQSFGYSSSKEIPKAHYKEICEKIENAEIQKDGEDDLPLPWEGK